MSFVDQPTDRRRVLVLASAAGAAVLAACGKKSKSAATSPTTTTVAVSAGDVSLLTTAASLEELEVAVYKHGMDAGIFKTPAVVDAVKALLAAHQNHAGLFEGHASRLGGATPIAANAALNAQLQPRIASADEPGLLHVLFDLAQITTATYQAALDAVTDTRLNTVFMSVCGAEARHAALLGTMIGQSVPTASFGSPAAAVK